MQPNRVSLFLRRQIKRGVMFAYCHGLLSMRHVTAVFRWFDLRAL